MKFYNREKELILLQDTLKRSRQEAQMTVLMGRRRIGKTELSLRCGDKTILYFFVGKKSEALLCSDFVTEIKEKLDTPILGQPTSFAEVFRFVLRVSEESEFTLIIDEFQNFLKVNPNIFGDIQREWDLYKSRSRINIIISGSVFTLMKQIFEDKAEPLFGRANSSIVLQPFTTDILKQIISDFNSKYKKEDLLTLYCITGGVPWYVSMLLDKGMTKSSEMLASFADENSPFMNEGRNILVEEFGTDYITYFSILTSIAGGMKTRAEIENQIGNDNIGSYLAKLENYYKLIKKSLPIFSKANSKKVRYVINDCFLLLWFRFFYKHQALIENRAFQAFSEIVSRDFGVVSGLMMERYFIQKYQEQGRYIVGKWWDRKGKNEIDLIVVDPIKKEAWIYELKKNALKFKEDLLRKKAALVVSQTPELRNLKIHIGLLTLEDM